MSENFSPDSNEIEYKILSIAYNHSFCGSYNKIIYIDIT